jgi:hypothetical protein
LSKDDAFHVAKRAVIPDIEQLELVAQYVVLSSQQVQKRLHQATSAVGVADQSCGTERHAH